MEACGRQISPNYVSGPWLKQPNGVKIMYGSPYFSLQWGPLSLFPIDQTSPGSSKIVWRIRQYTWLFVKVLVITKNSCDHWITV